MTNQGERKKKIENEEQKSMLDLTSLCELKTEKQIVSNMHKTKNPTDIRVLNVGGKYYDSNFCQPQFRRNEGPLR